MDYSRKGKRFMGRAKMTKQEEMLRVIKGILLMKIPAEFRLKTPEQIAFFRAEYIISVLNEYGVVTKVRCPDCNWSQFVGEESVGMTPCYSCNSTGYLIEPLIKEG